MFVLEPRLWVNPVVHWGGLEVLGRVKGQERPKLRSNRIVPNASQNPIKEHDTPAYGSWDGGETRKNGEI